MPKTLRIGIVAFQMSSETHARAANAAAAAAKAKGWDVTLLNARGAIPRKRRGHRKPGQCQASMR